MTTLQNPYAPGGFLEGLRAGAAGMALNEWCQHNAHECEWAHHDVGGPYHWPLWRVTLRVRMFLIFEGAEENAVNVEGYGSTVKRARDEAAAAALDRLDAGWRARLAAPASAGAQQPNVSHLGTGLAALVMSPAQRRSLALIGDAALDLLVVLLASSAGLNAAGMDGARQRLLNNNALGGPAAATMREAAIGTSVCALQTPLAAMLESAVRMADPQLI